MAIPPGVSLAPTNGPFDDPPTWIRLDTLAGLNITSISITRGRPDERSKTSPASVSIKGIDQDGILDPTNPNSPFAGELNPVKQAAITMFNPYTESWNWIFRGYVSDYTLSFDTDASESFMDFEITLTDMLDLLNDSEVIPDEAGNLSPDENVGDTFYTGQHVDDRILAVLADASTAFYEQIWPASQLQIASGNVFVQGTDYTNQSSLLQVIDDACDAEYPYGTNRFITQDGSFAFRGRYYRFLPELFIAFDGNRRQNNRMLEFFVVDVPSYSVGHSQAIAQTISFTRGKTNLINAALITPANIRQDQIAAQQVSNSPSIGTYGPRTSGMSLENLITSDPSDPGDSNTPIQECKSYGQSIVDNYKDPVTRVSQLKFTNPSNNTNDEGMNLWHLLTNVELSDFIHVTTKHPGGGGFDDDTYYVEQITYDIEPLQGDIWQVQLTLDLTSFAYYQTMPESWAPPSS
jgi:hypothetical protein